MFFQLMLSSLDLQYTGGHSKLSLLGIETRGEVEANISLSLDQSHRNIPTFPTLPNMLPCEHITSLLQAVLEGIFAIERP